MQFLTRTGARKVKMADGSEFWDLSIPRDDEVLVQIVEELGCDASQDGSALVIQEIPDDVERWYIKDDDGNETVVVVEEEESCDEQFFLPVVPCQGRRVREKSISYLGYSIRPVNWGYAVFRKSARIAGGFETRVEALEYVDKRVSYETAQKQARPIYRRRFAGT